MDPSVSLVTIYVHDQDEAKAFYVDKLGFAEGDDFTMGDGYRWLTVVPPGAQDLSLTLYLPGPPMSDEDAAEVRRLLAKGAFAPIGISVDDCRAAHEDYAATGVTIAATLWRMASTWCN